MVRTNCSVYGCYSTSKNNKDLKFHRFPRDERRQLWIEACKRPDLRDKSIEQLYNMHVCGLHFEGWMYMNKKLKDAAIPVSNLPSASLHTMSTQTEEDLTNRIVKQDIDIASVDVSVVASTSAHASQTTTKFTDHPRKTKLRRQITSCVKKLKLMQNAKVQVHQQQHNH